MELHLNALKLAQAGMTMEKGIVISSRGSVVLQAQLLHGNNAETIVKMTTAAMVVQHHHGLLVAEAEVEAIAINKVDMVVLLAVELHLGNDSKKLHPRLLQAVATADMVDIQEAMERVMGVSRAWVLLLAWEVVLVVSVLLQVWVPFSKTMAPMARQVVLHLHLLLMICLPL